MATSKSHGFLSGRLSAKKNMRVITRESPREEMQHIKINQALQKLHDSNETKNKLASRLAAKKNNDMWKNQ